MKIKVGFSPCPNDTYILGAWHNKLINPLAFELEPVIADVEELNSMAMEGILPLSKMSYHTFFHVSDGYDLLSAGGALGHGNGPLLVKRKGSQIDLENAAIGIPGELTTANFLLQFAYPFATKGKSMLFSDIPNALINGEIDAGVIIHETRFLYEKLGLEVIADLGKIWEEKTSSPIPLGCFAIRKDISAQYGMVINNIIKRSIIFAEHNYKALSTYIKSHAQELDEQVIQSHIKMFVNEYSHDLGLNGIKAIDVLFRALNKKYKNNYSYQLISDY